MLRVYSLNVIDTVRNEEATTLPRPPKLGIYDALELDAVMPLDMTPDEMENIQHTERAYNVMRDLCQRKSLCIYQAPRCCSSAFSTFFI